MVDRAYLLGDRELFHSANAMAGKPIIGSFSAIGKPVSQETIDRVRSLWQQENSQADVGVTELISGLLCRYRGDSTAEVKKWFTNVWHLLREIHLKRSPIIPRVWQL
jgi:urease accessory protein